MLSSFAWGYWSDRHGRRPVLQVAMLGLAVTTLAFGFSTSIYWAIAARFIGGVSAGGNHLTGVAVAIGRRVIRRALLYFVWIITNGM